jgi:arginine:agmatine antiporter
MLVASSMIGSGIFLLPASLGAIGSISILAWIAAVLGAALIGGVFAILAVINPGTRGLFSYVRDAFGPCPGFVIGVLYWASCLVACVAIALAVTGYSAVYVPIVAKPPANTIVTTAVIWLLLGANMIGPRFVARILSLTFGLGLAPVLLAAFGGWFFFHASTFTQSWNVTGESLLSVVPRTTVMVFWAFLGIEAGIVLSARVKNPRRDVPIGTLGGLAIAGVVYMSACAAIMGILPASALAKSSAPFADATVPVLGATAAGAVALCAMLKASGTLAGALLATLETSESESVLGEMRAVPLQQSARASIPTLLFTGLLTSLIVFASQSPTLARQFTIVTDVSVVLSVMVYGASALALLRLSGMLVEPSRMWVRILAICCALFCATLIAASERDLLIWAVGATVIALIAYQAVWTRRRYALRTMAGS